MLRTSTEHNSTNLSRSIKSGHQVGPYRVPTTLVGIGLTAILAGCLIPLVQKSAHSGPAAPTHVSNRPSVLNVSDNTRAIRVAANPPQLSAEKDVRRRSLNFYTGDVRAGMFSEPVAPAPPVPPTPKPIKPVPPAPVDPYADWNYTGSATIGTEKIAILENINTHDGVLVHVGEDFMGSKVADIDGSFLTLEHGNTPKVLRVSMNTSYVPLSKGADFLTAKSPQQGGPQDMQAQMAALMAMRGGGQTGAAGGPSVTLPNGTVLSGQQMQRYQNRLNRGWNGNGGGGGGFGGGNGGGGGGGGGRRGGRGGGG